MKPVMQFFFLALMVLVATTFCYAQEPKENKALASDGKQSVTKVDGFEWLKQLQGTWTAVSKTPNSDAKESVNTAVIQSRVLGELWVVSQHKGKFGETAFEAVQTLGYDQEKKQFVGTWIDSATSYTWHLAGNLDESGKKLTLNAKGPDWNDSKKTRNYRDSYEFKSANQISVVSQMQNDDGKWETFMSGNMTKVEENKTSVTPFLMFTGKAEEAIEYYKTVFPGTTVESMTKYKAGEAGPEGTIQVATFVVAGQRIKCTDSPPVHDFDFTPSFSFFVECESEEQLQERFDKLSKDGKVMMPPNNYGFSKKFAWTSDKFGVSWQLNLGPNNFK